MNAEVNNELPNNAAVTDQPKTEEKRQSAASDVRIEISDNDDDEVFCEGTGPPVKLADNLGTPHNKSQGVIRSYLSFQSPLNGSNIEVFFDD